MKPNETLFDKRSYVFRKQRVHVDLEDRVRELLSGSAGSDTVRVVLGRVLGTSASGETQDVALPFASEAILDGSAHRFEPGLPGDMMSAVRGQLETCRESWEAEPAAVRRWAEVSVSESVSAEAAAIREALTVYCPGGRWHYQLQVGRMSGQPPTECRQRKEARRKIPRACF